MVQRFRRVAGGFLLCVMVLMAFAVMGCRRSLVRNDGVFAEMMHSAIYHPNHCCLMRIVWGLETGDISFLREMLTDPGRDIGKEFSAWQEKWRSVGGIAECEIVWGDDKREVITWPSTDAFSKEYSLEPDRSCSAVLDCFCAHSIMLVQYGKVVIPPDTRGVLTIKMGDATAVLDIVFGNKQWMVSDIRLR